MASGRIYVGVDIGGTKLGVNAIDENRKQVSPVWVEVPAYSHLGPMETVKQISVGLKEFAKTAGISMDQVAGLGIDSPGPADINGKIEKTSNMHPAWEGFQLRDEAEKTIRQATGRNVPVSYENDCNAAALWESFIGNPEGTEVMALLAQGTGLGGGIVIQGRLLRGARGMGAELGHLEIVHPWFVPGEEVPRCGCGQQYCAEAYASMAALMRLLPGALRMPQYANHSLNSIKTEPGEDIWRKRAYQVRGLAAKGDPLCQAIFDWQCEAVAKLCRQVADTIDPDRIVIGGGFIEGGEELTARIMKLIWDNYAKLGFKKHVAEMKIERAKSGDLAGCLGAALSAWQKVNGNK